MIFLWSLTIGTIGIITLIARNRIQIGKKIRIILDETWNAYCFICNNNPLLILDDSNDVDFNIDNNTTTTSSSKAANANMNPTSYMRSYI